MGALSAIAVFLVVAYILVAIARHIDFETNWGPECSECGANPAIEAVLWPLRSDPLCSSCDKCGCFKVPFRPDPRDMPVGPPVD